MLGATLKYLRSSKLLSHLHGISFLNYIIWIRQRWFSTFWSDLIVFWMSLDILINVLFLFSLLDILIHDFPSSVVSGSIQSILHLLLLGSQVLRVYLFIIWFCIIKWSNILLMSSINDILLYLLFNFWLSYSRILSAKLNFHLACLSIDGCTVLVQCRRDHVHRLSLFLNYERSIWSSIFWRRSCTIHLSSHYNFGSFTLFNIVYSIAGILFWNNVLCAWVLLYSTALLHIE